MPDVVVWLAGQPGGDFCGEKCPAKITIGYNGRNCSEPELNRSDQHERNEPLRRRRGEE